MVHPSGTKKKKTKHYMRLYMQLFLNCLGCGLNLPKHSETVAWPLQGDALFLFRTKLAMTAW